MIRTRAVLLCLACILLSAGIAQADAPRVALVIGNAAYEERGDYNLFGPLSNPLNDAQDMRIMLQRYGFTIVSAGDDLTKHQMERAVNDFVTQLQPGGVALFYYSGHGVQVENENYLLPTGRNYADAVDVKDTDMSANWILKKMELAQARINIMILDACREEMELPSLQGQETKGFGDELGFAQMSAPAAIISYATSPGKTSFGSKKGRNSIYTRHLLDVIATSGNLSIEDVFKLARKKVAAQTKRQQLPWTGNNLTEDFCFGGCIVATPTPKVVYITVTPTPRPTVKVSPTPTPQPTPSPPTPTPTSGPSASSTSDVRDRYLICFDKSYDTEEEVQIRSQVISRSLENGPTQYLLEQTDTTGRKKFQICMGIFENKGEAENKRQQISDAMGYPMLLKPLQRTGSTVIPTGKALDSRGTKPSSPERVKPTVHVSTTSTPVTTPKISLKVTPSPESALTPTVKPAKPTATPTPFPPIKIDIGNYGVYTTSAVSAFKLKVIENSIKLLGGEFKKEQIEKQQRQAYRVSLGYYRTKQEAKAWGKQYLSPKKIDHYVYAAQGMYSIQLGVYSERAMIDRVYKSLYQQFPGWRLPIRTEITMLDTKAYNLSISGISEASAKKIQDAFFRLQIPAELNGI